MCLIGSYLVDKSPDGSIHHDSKQSHISHKVDFLTSVNTYIDYFLKSENASYRNMKAGQYFRGNIGKSHRSLQKELEISNHELRSLKIQAEKLSWKVNELTASNKILSKELKSVHAREEEHQQLLHKMQEQLVQQKQKTRKYKSQCLQMQDLFQQEREENESNLISLKQAVARYSISNVILF